MLSLNLHYKLYHLFQNNISPKNIYSKNNYTIQKLINQCLSLYYLNDIVYATRHHNKYFNYGDLLPYWNILNENPYKPIIFLYVYKSCMCFVHKIYVDASYHHLYDNICLKTVLYFCKRTVLKVLCYQNIYAGKHERNLHIFIGDNHGVWKPY